MVALRTPASRLPSFLPHCRRFRQGSFLVHFDDPFLDISEIMQLFFVDSRSFILVPDDVGGDEDEEVGLVPAVSTSS